MHRRRIVVGIGGHAGWQALAWAVGEASQTNGRLELWYAVDAASPLAAYGQSPPLSVLELSSPQLARAVSAARVRLGGDRVRLSASVNGPGRTLVAAARTANLVVLGAPQRSGWMARGSTTHEVITGSPTATVVVRTDPGGAHGPFAGHIVAGVDGSQSAHEALGFAFDTAAAHRRPLVVVHVTSHGPADVWFDEGTPEPHFAEQPQVLDMLGEQIEPWTHKFPDVSVKRAGYAGKVRTGLLRAAAGARLLVVGSRGRGPAMRAVLGSVSHDLVDRAPCPVVVVPGDTRSAEVVR